MKCPLQNILAAKATHCISQGQKDSNSITFSTVDGETKARYTVSLKITTPKNHSLAAVAAQLQ
jgi:hypothetical protein